MPLSPRHWRARHLLGAWTVYWVALLAVTLGPGVLAVRRIQGSPKNTSKVDFSFGDQGLQGNVTSYGTNLWSVHAGVWEVVLWLVVPPLLLWLLWLALRPRSPAAPPPGGIGGASAGHAGAALPGAPVDAELARGRQATRERRESV